MRVDLVIDFYRKLHQWPLVVWGLRRNADHLNRVIVVNDEPWTEESRTTVEREAEGLPLLLLDHPHKGFGSIRCMNQGLAEVETEYWGILNADVILAPGSLAKTIEYAAPWTLIYPRVHDVPLELTLADLPNPRIVRRDGYGSIQPRTHQWARFRDLHTIEHTDSSRALGGRQDFPGYGWADNDYGCRWALRYGLDNILFAGGEAYTPGGCGAADKHIADSENGRLFKKTLDEFCRRYPSMKPIRPR